MELLNDIFKILILAFSGGIFLVCLLSIIISWLIYRDFKKKEKITKICVMGNQKIINDLAKKLDKLVEITRLDPKHETNLKRIEESDMLIVIANDIWNDYAYCFHRNLGYALGKDKEIALVYNKNKQYNNWIWSAVFCQHPKLNKYKNIDEIKFN